MNFSVNSLSDSPSLELPAAQEMPDGTCFRGNGDREPMAADDNGDVSHCLLSSCDGAVALRKRESEHYSEQRPHMGICIKEPPPASTGVLKFSPHSGKSRFTFSHGEPANTATTWRYIFMHLYMRLCGALPRVSAGSNVQAFSDQKKWDWS